MARRWGIGIGVATAIAVGAFVWLRPESPFVPEPELADVAAPSASVPVLPQVSSERALEAERENVAVEDAPRENWNEHYLASEDFFAFVAAAAPAALDGDARAQYLISRALLHCQVELLGEKAPPLPFAPRDKLRLCEQFHTAHPLDAFGLPAETKSFTYWRDLALANGDALAVVADAVRTFGMYEAARDAATKEQLRRQTLAQIRVVVESQDPGAILSLSVFAQQRPTQKPWMFASWYVAACELGLDCSKREPGIARLCATSRSCRGVQTVADTIQMVGHANDVYGAGLDIADKIKTGDWEGLQPHLALWD